LFITDKAYSGKTELVMTQGRKIFGLSLGMTGVNNDIPNPSNYNK
jgi:hypothetical protein